MNKLKALGIYVGVGGSLLLLYYYAIVVTIGIYRRCYGLMDVLVAVAISMLMFLFIIVSAIAIFKTIKHQIK